jgi:hypothetical protein
MTYVAMLSSARLLRSETPENGISQSRCRTSKQPFNVFAFLDPRLSLSKTPKSSSTLGT